ncbi:MAG: vWA domain-containing protein [Gemmataceae bacterium]
MASTIVCPTCGQALALDPRHAGMTGTCPRCGAVLPFHDPHGFGAAAPPPPTPPAPPAPPAPYRAPAGPGAGVTVAVISAFASLVLFAGAMFFRWHSVWGLGDFTLLFFPCVLLAGLIGVGFFRGYRPGLGVIGAGFGGYCFFVVFPSLFWTTSVATKAPVDVVFVLDVTGSMQPEIDAVKDGINLFASVLFSRGLDSRIAVIPYRDQFDAEAPMYDPVLFDGDPFTRDPVRFSEAVKKLEAKGGGDEPESTLDAVAYAARQPFRGRANKVLILITDASCHMPDKEMKSFEDVGRQLRLNDIGQLHIVTHESLFPLYRKLHEAAPGRAFTLTRAGVASLRELPEVALEVATTSMQRRGAGVGLWIALPATLLMLGSFLFLAIARPLELSSLGLSTAPGFLNSHGAFLGSVGAAGILGLVFVILTFV